MWLLSQIMHGGLFSEDGVTLDDIRKIERNRQPPDSGGRWMPRGAPYSLLWHPSHLRGTEMYLLWGGWGTLTPLCFLHRSHV